MQATFLFRRAPLVPGTASHTRLMASLEGGQEEDELVILIVFAVTNHPNHTQETYSVTWY